MVQILHACVVSDFYFTNSLLRARLQCIHHTLLSMHNCAISYDGVINKCTPNDITSNEGATNECVSNKSASNKCASNKCASDECVSMAFVFVSSVCHPLSTQLTSPRHILQNFLFISLHTPNLHLSFANSKFNPSCAVFFICTMNECSLDCTLNKSELH